MCSSIWQTDSHNFFLLGLDVNPSRTHASLIQRLQLARCPTAFVFVSKRDWYIIVGFSNKATGAPFLQATIGTQSQNPRVHRKHWRRRGPHCSHQPTIKRSVPHHRIIHALGSKGRASQCLPPAVVRRGHECWVVHRETNAAPNWGSASIGNNGNGAGDSALWKLAAKNGFGETRRSSNQRCLGRMIHCRSLALLSESVSSRLWTQQKWPLHVFEIVATCQGAFLGQKVGVPKRRKPSLVGCVAQQYAFASCLYRAWYWTSCHGSLAVIHKGARNMCAVKTQQEAFAKWQEDGGKEKTLSHQVVRVV